MKKLEFVSGVDITEKNKAKTKKKKRKDKNSNHYPIEGTEAERIKYLGYRDDIMSRQIVAKQ